MIFYFIIFLPFLFSMTLGQKKDYTNYTVFRSIPMSSNHLDFIKNLSTVIGVDYWKLPGSLNKPIDILIGPAFKNKFKIMMQENNYPFDTIIKNVQKAFDLQTVRSYIRRNMASFGWKNYYRINDIYDWMYDLASAYPREVTIINLGNTYRGRDILCAKVNLGGTQKRSTVIVEGGIHAREWVSTSVATYFLNEIVNSDNSEDKALRSIALTYEWYFVPCLNPDGYEYSHTTDRNWRKNCKEEYGVDINRNFDSAFGTVGVSYFESQITYCGPMAFSEEESVAMAKLVRSKKEKLEYYLAFHSYGQCMIIPYAYSKEHWGNYEEMANILRTAKMEVAKRYGTKYSVGTAYDTIGYTTSGVSGCWVKGAFHVPYVATFELRDEGKDGFALPPNQIMPTCLEIMDGLKSILMPKSAKYTKLEGPNLKPGNNAHIILVQPMIVLCSIFMLPRFDNKYL